MVIKKSVTQTLLVLCASVALAGCFGGKSSKKGPVAKPLPEVVSTISVAQVWNMRIGDVNFPLVPKAVNGQVALADSKGTVWMLNASTGGVVWQASVGKNLSAGVGSNGRITAVVTKDNDLVALDEQGRELWRKRVTTQVLTPPLVAGGRIFLNTAEHSVQAFDASNGAGLWRQKQDTADSLILRRDGTLDTYGNTLILGMTSNLYGVNPDTGAPLWGAPIGKPRGTNEIDRLADLVGGVARSGNIFCACSYQNAVSCVKEGGEVLWSKRSTCEYGVSVDHGNAYVVEADGRIYALNQNTGDTQWVNEQLRYRQLTGALAMGDRTLVVGDSDGNIHLLSREDGSFMGRLTTNSSGIAITPVEVNGTLVVVTRNGTVYGFRPQ